MHVNKKHGIRGSACISLWMDMPRDATDWLFGNGAYLLLTFSSLSDRSGQAVASGDS